MKSEAKNETPARIVLTFARARFKSNEEPDDEILSFTVQISEDGSKNCGVDFTSPSALRRKNIQGNNLDAAVGNIGL